MQKLSQTEELARELAAHARRHTVTPEQLSRAMDERDFDVAQLDELYTALEARGVQLAEADDASRTHAQIRIHVRFSLLIFSPKWAGGIRAPSCILPSGLFCVNDFMET